jgi:hypothetical protein
LLLLSPVGGHGAAGAAGRWLLRHNDGIVIVTLLAILVIVIAEQVHPQVLAQQQFSSVNEKKAPIMSNFLRFLDKFSHFFNVNKIRHLTT